MAPLAWVPSVPTPSADLAAVAFALPVPPSAIAIGEDKLLSTAAIIGIYGLAGEMASKVAKGPGSLRMHLLDNLTNLTKDEVLENINIQNV